MMITAITYLVIQIPGIAYIHESSERKAKGEQPFALFGLIFAFLLLILYLVYQYIISRHPDPNGVLERQLDDAYIEAIQTGKISLLGLMTAEFQKDIKGSNEATPLRSAIASSDAPPDAIVKLRKLLKPFFHKYDRDHSGHLDIDELGVVFQDLGEDVKSKELEIMFSKFDTDKNGSIDYEEFVKGVAEFVMIHGIRKENFSETIERTATEDKTAEDEAEEEEEMPDDLKDLTPSQQQFRIRIRAAWMLLFGTAIVLLISDPMVSVLAELGDRIHVSPFYVSFVLAPIASNASELIAAYNYSLKKTPSSIAVSISALQGAAIMNNTFVLGVFLVLIYSQALVWEFFAETLSILVIEILIAIYSFKSCHTIFDGFVILSFYPLSLVLVILLEKVGWN